MVPITGNGVGSMDGMGSQVVGHGHNQPPATEYTLQGVMRFLQTEWHRHERDRNAWEIERQEMRGRIANLEGQARRADATQKALRKYVNILERKVKEQTAQIKGEDAAHADAAAKNDRAAQIEAKLKSTAETHVVPGVEDIELDRPDDEGQRQDLKTFLDQCQNEFMYLMITPANPQPPRESPQLPIIEDLREVDFGSVPGGQPMERQYPAHQRSQNHINDAERQQAQQQQQQAMNHTSNAASKQNPNAFASRNDAQAQPMMRSGNENQPATPYNVHPNTHNDWNGPISVTTRMVEDHADSNSIADMSEDKDKRSVKDSADIEGWEFPEGTFPEPGGSQIPSNRPDTDVFPNAENLPKSPNRPPGQHRRKSSSSRRQSAEREASMAQKAEIGNFKLRYGLRGHLNAVRSVIFSGGGSPGEPEICTAGDDSMIKRFHIPRLDGHGSSWNTASDLDVTANFTHRGHSGAVLCLASWSPAPNFTAGGRAQGDGWIFSGGQDATIRVWERGRVDPKATLEGHTDAVWALCVLPATLGSVFGASSPHGSADRILLASGAADGSVRLWSVTSPPQLSSPQPGANRGVSGRGGRVRGNSMSSGSGFSSTPQPTMASSSPFNHTLIHNIVRSDGSTASPTAIAPLGNSAESFIVSYSDAAVIVYDTRTGELLGNMDSMETYDGSKRTGVNTIVATTVGLDQAHHSGMSDDESNAGGPTGGGRSGVEGTIISGHEDRFVRFFDANSGQCTYNMVAHPDAVSSLSLSPDGLELVSGGHDASLRFWNLEKRTCIQEITAHRPMRGEGVCSVVWSQDGKWVVSGGGDGVVKVFAR